MDGVNVGLKLCSSVGCCLPEESIEATVQPVPRRVNRAFIWSFQVAHSW